MDIGSTADGIERSKVGRPPRFSPCSVPPIARACSLASGSATGRRPGREDSVVEGFEDRLGWVRKALSVRGDHEMESLVVEVETEEDLGLCVTDGSAQEQDEGLP